MKRNNLVKLFGLLITGFTAFSFASKIDSHIVQSKAQNVYQTYTFDFANDGKGDADNKCNVWTATNVLSVTLTKGTNSNAVVTTDDAIATPNFLKGNIVTFSSLNSCKIAKLHFVSPTLAKGKYLQSPGKGVENSSVWTSGTCVKVNDTHYDWTFDSFGSGTSNSFSFTVGAQIQLSSLSVEYYVSETVSGVTISSPEFLYFSQNDSFEISGEVNGAYDCEKTLNWISSSSYITTPSSSESGDNISVNISNVCPEGEYWVKATSVGDESKSKTLTFYVCGIGNKLSSTSSIVDGYYVISSSNHGISNILDNGSYKSNAINIVGDKVHSVDYKTIWKIEKNGDYWTLFNNNINSYLCSASSSSTSNRNLIVSETVSSDYAKWTIAYDSDESGFRFINLGRGTDTKANRNIAYSSAGDFFALYADNTSLSIGFDLYKVDSNNLIVDSLAISTIGSKTSYFINEALDLSNVTVQANYLYAQTGLTSKTNIALSSLDSITVDGNVVDSQTEFVLTNEMLGNYGSLDLEVKFEYRGAYSSYYINLTENVGEIALSKQNIFNKVVESQDDWSGRYLLVCSNGIFDSSLSDIDVTNNIISYNKILNNTSITGNQYSAYCVTITKSESDTSKYLISDSTGKYYGNNSSSNSLDRIDDPYELDISITENNNVVITGTYVTKSKTYTYYLDTYGSRLRFYSSNHNTLYLYKETLVYDSYDSGEALTFARKFLNEFQNNICQIDGGSVNTNTSSLSSAFEAISSWDEYTALTDESLAMLKEVEANEGGDSIRKFAALYDHIVFCYNKTSGVTTKLDGVTDVFSRSENTNSILNSSNKYIFTTLFDEDNMDTSLIAFVVGIISICGCSIMLLKKKKEN